MAQRLWKPYESTPEFAAANALNVSSLMPAKHPRPGQPWPDFNR